MSEKRTGRCTGYGPDGERIKCEGTPGTLWTDYWCPECDERRRERIGKLLRALTEPTREGER